MCNALLCQVLIAGHIGKLLKQAGKVELGKACQVRKLLYGNIFCTVVSDIVAYHHKFFYIFVLLIAGDTGKFGIGIKVGPPQRCKEPDHQGINTCFGKGHGIIVFPDHFVQIKMQAAVKLRIFLPGDQSVGKKRVEQSVHGIDIADQAVIKQQDQPLAVRRGDQLVKRTGGGVIQMSPS